MLKKLFYFFAKETNFILLCIFIITFLGLFSLFYDQWVIRPENTVYTFAHNYMFDYYQYLSWMKDGADGKILITSRFSPDNFIRKPVYLFYPIMGFIFSKLGLSLFLGYTLARIFLSLVKFLAIYYLISQIFNDSFKRKLAFVFCLFLPPFYGISPLRMLFPHIASVDILQRAFFLPHDMATTVFIILGTISFSQWLNKGEIKGQVKGIFKGQLRVLRGLPSAPSITLRMNPLRARKSATTKPLITNYQLLITSFLFFFLASIINPAILTIFYLFLGLATLLTFVQKPSLRGLVGPGIIFLAGLPFIVYYQYLFKTTLPFSWMYYQQKNVFLNINFKDYLLSLGPVSILFIFGLPAFLKKKDFLFNFLICWAIIPFFLMPLLGRIIPLSQERLFEISHFIPLSILATEGLIKIKNAVMVRLLIGILLFFSLPYLYISVKFQVDLFTKPYFNIYIPKSVIETFNWLDKNTPDESIVVANYFTSNMLPAFSHNKVLFGHDFVTYKAAQRLEEVKAVFNPKTPANQIREILRRNKVDYLLVSPEGGGLEWTNLKNVDGLELVFSNLQNFVFRISK